MDRKLRTIHECNKDATGSEEEESHIPDIMQMIPTKKRRLANSRQILTCFSCIVFIAFIQIADCRHHDQKNVINCFP